MKLLYVPEFSLSVFEHTMKSQTKEIKMQVSNEINLMNISGLRCV